MFTKTLTGDYMEGFYLLCSLLVVALIIDQDKTITFLTAASLKIQIYYLNYRLKWQAWLMYRQLVRLCKEADFPEPGPFRFVNIWDRDTNS